MAITLKAARVNKGYSQEEAAKLIGIGVNTLRNYENGTTFPNVDRVRRIEQAYGVSYNDLIFLPEKSI